MGRPAPACASLAIALATASIALAATPSTAAAKNSLCSAVGVANTAAGRACTALSQPGRIVGAGKKLLGGDPLGALGSLVGDGGGGGGSGAGSTASSALGLAAIGVWVLGGATFALHETAKVLSDTSAPQLGSTWFSSAYWRIAGIGAVLTLPFLFAAAAQALIRTELALLLRAALGYLPLALLAVSVAAPVTMLLLAASDQMSAVVSSAAGNAGVHFLEKAGVTIGGLTVVTGSPFIAFLVGLFTAAGALVLWIELLMREAAVYVIVLMLPVVFAAFVWPARRVWVLRAIEVLVALILSKFAIVAVLALGGAAMDSSLGHSVTGFLGGVVLLVMGAFAPWALLRLVPLAELASGAAGALRSEARVLRAPAAIADSGARWADERWAGDDWATAVTTGMRRQANELPELAISQVGGAGQQRAATGDPPRAPGPSEAGARAAAIADVDARRSAAAADGPNPVAAERADPVAAERADPVAAERADPVAAERPGAGPGEGAGAVPPQASDAASGEQPLTIDLLSDGVEHPERTLVLGWNDGDPPALWFEDAASAPAHAGGVDGARDASGPTEAPADGAGEDDRTVERPRPDGDGRP
jgi:hypothetical protein